MYSVDDTDAHVVARTNLPDAIDPALRRPGRFYLGIEICWFSGLFSPRREILQKTHVGVPDLNAHISILTILLANTSHSITSDGLHATASCTHDYVSTDLAAFVCEAGMLAIKRFLALAPLPSAESAHLMAPDLATALSTVHPFMLRAHAIATPPAHFADIGGLTSTIAHLRECVEWSLVHRERLACLGVRAPKGVLLCGPPGCSKTVLVRATAAESGVNFVAMRRPEVRTFDCLLLVEVETI